MWNELRAEWEQLFAKGYTGEGFLGAGKQLGGGYVPADEVRRRARVAAADREKERIQRGRRLGASSGEGRSGSLGIRDTVAIAAIKRASADDNKPRRDGGKGKGRSTSITSTASDEEITAGCGQGSKRAGQEAEDAMANGFATKDDMDNANWIAIQEAQFELEQIEEQKRLMMGLPQTEQRSEEREGGYTWDPEYGLRMTGSAVKKPELPKSTPPQAQQMPKAPAEAKGQRRPGSKVAKDGKQKKPARAPTNTTAADAPSRAGSSSVTAWDCPACTFVNRSGKPTCEMCETPRPLPKSAFSSSLGWNCHTCGTFMGHEWWTCSSCGSMKLSS
jgi:DNA-dependent metalloprotease WSS1